MKIKRLNHKYILDRFLKSRKARLILFGTKYHQVIFFKLGGLSNRPTRTSFRLRVMVRTIFGHAQEVAWFFCGGIFRPDMHGKILAWWKLVKGTIMGVESQGGPREDISQGPTFFNIISKTKADLIYQTIRPKSITRLTIRPGFP